MGGRGAQTGDVRKNECRVYRKMVKQKSAFPVLQGRQPTQRRYGIVIVRYTVQIRARKPAVMTTDLGDSLSPSRADCQRYGFSWH